MRELAGDELVEATAGIAEVDGVGDREGEHVRIDLLRRCIDCLDLHLGDGGCYPKPSQVTPPLVAGVDRRARAALSSGPLATELAQGSLKALLLYLVYNC